MENESITSASEEVFTSVEEKCPSEDKANRGKTPLGVSFDESQKKFFRLVKDGVAAIFALVLFALSFAPIYGYTRMGYKYSYSNVDIIAMMFDTAYDWDLNDYSEEWGERVEQLHDEYNAARAEGNVDKVLRLINEENILSLRAFIRMGIVDADVYIVRGLIGLFMIVFAFGMAAINILVFVRQLAGKEGMPAALCSKQTGKPFGGSKDILFAGYLFYLILFLLSFNIKNISIFNNITGTMATAIAISVIGTVMYFAGAFLRAERSAYKRMIAGTIVFVAGVTAVGALFSSAVTLRDGDNHGSATVTFFLCADLTDEEWATYDDTLLDMSYEEKQAYIAELFNGGYLYNSDKVESDIIQLLVVYDKAHMTNMLASGYYLWLFAAAAIGAAAVFSLAYGTTGSRSVRGFKIVFVVLGAVGAVLCIAVSAIVVGMTNSNISYLELSSLGVDVQVGMGAGGITAFIVFVAGVVASALFLSLHKKKKTTSVETADGRQDEILPENKEKEEESCGFLCKNDSYGVGILTNAGFCAEE